MNSINRLSGTIPFQSDCLEKILAKNKEAALKFPPKYWSTISKEAKDLVKFMTATDPKARCSTTEALNSPFIMMLTGFEKKAYKQE